MGSKLLNSNRIKSIIDIGDSLIVIRFMLNLCKPFDGNLEKSIERDKTEAEWLKNVYFCINDKQRIEKQEHKISFVSTLWKYKK